MSVRAINEEPFNPHEGDHWVFTDFATVLKKLGTKKEVFISMVNFEYAPRWVSVLANALRSNSNLERMYFRFPCELKSEEVASLLSAAHGSFRVLDLYTVQIKDFDAKKIAPALDASSIEHLFLRVDLAAAQSLLSLMRRKGVTISTETHKMTNAGDPVLAMGDI